MATDSLKITLLRWLPVAIIGGLLLVSLSLLHLVMQDPREHDYANALLYLNGFILLLLSVVILVNVVRMIYQWHNRQAGSRFTLRLMAGFLFLTLLPVLIVSFFSMNFIGKNINKQFNDRLEVALEDALDLTRLSLSSRGRSYLQQLSVLGENLPEKNTIEISALMSDWVAQMGAEELTLFAEDLSYVTSISDSIGTLIPKVRGSDLNSMLSDRRAAQQLEIAGSADDQHTYSRVALRVVYGIENKRGILAALFQLPEKERTLVQSVEKAHREYKEFSFHRSVFKGAFRVALLVIIVLTVLFSLWAAFIFSRRLTQPVRDLVEGTLAVASGDLEKKLPVSDRDDFNLLSRSFNTMTKRLAHVQNERELARNQLQQEHDYLDVVLEHLSSGVVTLDDQMVLRRVNSAASQILQQPIQNLVGDSINNLATEFPPLNNFVQSLQPWLSSPSSEWQAEVELLAEGQRKVLICRGASLPNSILEQQGYVLVFEDVTDVLQAEHDAAWSEVARRLAHEIKNPLTPIQLSAERLARKLGKELDEDAQNFLQRMTGTIIQQVDVLKSMVNAFSDYAKAPALMMQPVDLNDLVKNVVELYQGNVSGIEIKLSIGELPEFSADPHRLRQLLVNLLKNAIEAMTSKQLTGAVAITTAAEITKAGPTFVVITVKDDGPGIPEDMLPRLFEPYVTSKQKGTGLGLAIVKKIVEEHGGVLSAKNSEVKGAIITVKLPIMNAGSIPA